MDKRYCLCCGKEIENGLWHEKCIRGFFGSEELPEIKLCKDELEKVAIEQINDKRAVTGGQEKLSLHLEVMHLAIQQLNNLH